MKKIDHKGAIDHLFLIALVVLVAVGGFTVWRISNSSQSNQASQANQNQATTEASEMDSDTDTTDPAETLETEQYATYTNDTYNFTMQYPDSDDWILTAAEGSVSDNESIVLVKYDCGPNCGLAFNMLLDSENPESVEDLKDQFSTNTVYELSSEEDVQLGGVSGTKLVFSPTEEEENIDDVVYVVANQIADTYLIQINMNGATTDGVDITEAGLEILESLTFNVTQTRS